MTEHAKYKLDPKDKGYLRRFLRVIEYIYAHLDEDPDLNTLAEVAALSPWHWHRVWQSANGESIVATVKRLRLHRAADDLAQTDLLMAQISRRAGYGSQAAFSRSFKQTYGQTPSAYRSAGPAGRFELANGGLPTSDSRGNSEMHNVEIQSLPAEKLAVIRHTGPYIEIGEAFEKLAATVAARGLFGKIGRMKGLYYSDPTSVPEEELQSAACVVVPDDLPVEAPLEPATTRGGDYAVVRFKGPYTDLKFVYEWLYGDWLVQSGREPDDAPCIETYLNNPRDTAPSDLETEICLPLKAAA